MSFFMLDMVVLTFMLLKMNLNVFGLWETLVVDHSNESFLAVPPCVTVYYAVRVCSNFYVCG